MFVLILLTIVPMSCFWLPLRYLQTSTGLPLTYLQTSTGLPLRYLQISAGLPLRYPQISARLPLRYLQTSDYPFGIFKLLMKILCSSHIFIKTLVLFQYFVSKFISFSFIPPMFLVILSVWMEWIRITLISPECFSTCSIGGVAFFPAQNCFSRSGMFDSSFSTIASNWPGVYFWQNIFNGSGQLFSGTWCFVERYFESCKRARWH